jgi:hypothetical protein
MDNNDLQSPDFAGVTRLSVKGEYGQRSHKSRSGRIDSPFYDRMIVVNAATAFQ